MSPIFVFRIDLEKLTFWLFWSPPAFLVHYLNYWRGHGRFSGVHDSSNWVFLCTRSFTICCSTDRRAYSSEGMPPLAFTSITPSVLPASQWHSRSKDWYSVYSTGAVRLRTHIQRSLPLHPKSTWRCWQWISCAQDVPHLFCQVWLSAPEK